MDFSLPTQTQDLADELTRWADDRRERIGVLPPFEADAWKQLAADFGLFTIERAGGTVLDTAIGFMAAARLSIPGPMLEADLATATGNDEARDALEHGGLVSSVMPGPPRRVPVAWGAAAELVVDQATGEVVARGGLPAGHFADRAPHGWYERTEPSDGDPLEARRWLLAAALLTGLGNGALELATDHVRHRVQFGRTLGTFQAVQFRLAECLLQLEGSRLSVIDAAWRMSEDRPEAGVCAALAWLNAHEIAQNVRLHTHQVHGALGFCTETGLVRVTGQMQWLRLSLGRTTAVDYVMAHRRQQDGDPRSLVLEGFQV